MPLSSGEVSYRLELPDGKSGYAVIYIDGKEVGRTDIPALIWATSYPMGIKTNKYSSVYDKDYETPFEYSGIVDEIDIRIDAVNVNIEEELKRAANID